MPARNHQNRKSCEGCRYFRNLAIGRSYSVCHYMLDTGQSRGCDPENCTKYTPLKPGEQPKRPIWEEYEC